MKLRLSRLSKISNLKLRLNRLLKNLRQTSNLSNLNLKFVGDSLNKDQQFFDHLNTTEFYYKILLTNTSSLFQIIFKV